MGACARCAGAASLYLAGMRSGPDVGGLDDVVVDGDDLRQFGHGAECIPGSDGVSAAASAAPVRAHARRAGRTGGADGCRWSPFRRPDRVAYDGCPCEDRRLVALCAVVAPLVAAAPRGHGADARRGRRRCGQALAAPHVYAGGGRLAFGSAQLPAPLTAPLNSVVVARRPTRPPPTTDAGLLAGLGRRRRLRRGQRRLLRLARRRCGCRARSWPWRPPRTGRATGWPPWTAGCSPSATPASTGRWARHPLNQPIVGMAADAGRPGLLAGGLRRRGVRLRRRPVPRLDGRHAAGVAGGRHGRRLTTGPATGWWPADGGHLLLRQRPVLRLHRRHPAQRPGGGHGGDARRRWLLLRRLPTAGSFTFGRRRRSGVDLAGGSRRQLPRHPPGGRHHRWHPDGVGYWLLDPDGFNYSFANPPDPVAVADGVGHRVGGGRPGERRPRHRLLLQPVRTVRGVVRAVRHLGVGAGRGADPVLRLHRGHLRPGRAATPGCCRRRPRPCRATPCSTAPGRGRRPPRSTSAWWPRCGRTARS